MLNSMFNKFITITLIFTHSYVYADNFDEITVYDKKLLKESNKEKKLTTDIYDFTKNNPAVGIAGEGGRYGNKGFSIRGVDGNRIAITIDGNNLPQSEDPEVFQSYGKINYSRQLLNPDFIGGIEIRNGGGGFSSAEGLGGRVNFKTKNIYDILGDKKHGVFYKNSYSGKNNLNRDTLGLGFLSQNIDMMLLYTNSKENEIKNFGQGSRELKGRSRGWPDKLKSINEGLLFKANYFFNEENSFHLNYLMQNNRNKIDVLSYEPVTGLAKFSKRNGLDTNELDMVNLSYKYNPINSAIIDNFIINPYFSKFNLVAHTLQGNYDKKGNFSFGDDFFRNTENKNKGANIGIVLLPINTEHFGEQNLSFNYNLNSSSTNNLSRESYLFSNSKGDIYDINTVSALFNPVDTINHNINIKDDIYYNDKLNLNISASYESTKLKPKKAIILTYNTEKESNPPGARFNKFSYSAELEYKLTNSLTLASKISQNYRTPSVSDMYLQFVNFGVSFVANPNIRPEKSFLKQISLKTDSDFFNSNITLYQINYKDFIDYESKKTSGLTIENKPINIDKATSSGLEISSRIYLDEIIGVSDGVYADILASYAKGKMANNTNLLAIKPPSVKVSIGYDSSSDTSNKWGAEFSFYYSMKKSKSDSKWRDPLNDNQIDTFSYLSKSYKVLDFNSYYFLTNDIKLNFGIHNIFNENYITWDSLRNIRNYGVINQVGINGEGLSRYTSPKRYISAAIEFKF